MNKKSLFLIVLFLPAIIAGIWYLSVSGDNYTVSNVTSVSLIMADDTVYDYTGDSDKEFLVRFKKNIVSVEKQEFNPEVYSLYELRFERVHDSSIYYLCLSADVRNCLAYDEKGNWYRINKDYAREFLAKYEVSDVYRYSNIPSVLFASGGNTVTMSPTQAKWYYLLSDESYCELSSNTPPTTASELYVTAGNGFEFDFDVEPDWYNVKLYDGELLAYDGLLDTVAEFSYDKECQLRAVISAEWYEGTTSLYYGEAVYDFYFDYDIKASYSLSKETLNSGEVLFVKLKNADTEDLEITTTLEGVDGLIAYPNANNGKMILVPIPIEATAGEYRLSVKSDKTNLSIPFSVNAKDFGSSSVSFVYSETADEYSSALKSFKNEISPSFTKTTAYPVWAMELVSPVKKFVDDKEQYWISSPSFGAKQTVGGVEIAERNLGIHYVKSVAVDELPVRAIAHGTVVFSGVTTLYGNTVVLDHGMGVKSVYGHLDRLEYPAEQGYTVEMGAFLGNADSEDFAISSTEFFFGICVGDVFVNPYNFINEPHKITDTDKSEKIEFFFN